MTNEPKKKTWKDHWKETFLLLTIGFWFGVCFQCGQKTAEYIVGESIMTHEHTVTHVYHLEIKDNEEMEDSDD